MESCIYQEKNSGHCTLLWIVYHIYFFEATLFIVWACLWNKPETMFLFHYYYCCIYIRKQDIFKAWRQLNCPDNQIPFSLTPDFSQRPDGTAALKIDVQSALKINTDLGNLDQAGRIFQSQGSIPWRKPPNVTESIYPLLSKLYMSWRSMVSGSAGAHQETQFQTLGPSVESIFLPVSETITLGTVNTICHLVSAAKLWPQDTDKPHLDNLPWTTPLWLSFNRMGHTDASPSILIISMYTALQYCFYFRQIKPADDSAEDRNTN